MVKPLIEFLREVPDPRSKRKKSHAFAEILMLIIIGYLAGRESLRRINRWCQNHKRELKKHLKLKGGIPSVSTMSRAVCNVDEELLTLAFVNWIGNILSTKGIHIVIDGKALRGATERLKDKKTPYILNAIDAATKLVIAQLAIPEKTNEMTAIPQLLEILDITGSTVTIDAIGATDTIMEAIQNGSGHFVLQIKKNCPATYKEITDLFEDLEKEREEDADEFNRRYRNKYDEYSKNELNRDRYEYRTMKCYCNDEKIGEIRENAPYINCVGLSCQVRIPKELDTMGNDVTPGKEEFLKHGSRRHPRPTEGDAFTDEIQRVGLVANKKYSANELADIKRAHWSIENCLHHVLDEDFLEDKCPSKKGKVALSVLRKFAYNIARMIQMGGPDEDTPIIQIMDDVSGNLNTAARYLFEPIPSYY